MPYKDPDKRRACARRYNATHPEVLRYALARYRLAHPERRRASSRRYKAKHEQYYREYNHQYAIDLRSRFLDVYGRECARCHSKVERFLTVGHKNNDGKLERRIYGYYGMIRRAVEKPDHSRYETQCYNCNHIAWLDHLANSLMNTSYSDNSEKAIIRRTRMRQRWSKWRSRFFEIYGAVCAHCGEKDQRVLTLSHKNNDGNIDRFQNGRDVIRYAVRQPDHTKYETLCWNCNRGTEAN